MADCLKSNLSVQEPVYCTDASGNILPDSAMYSWMAVRAAGPNVLRDNQFCGENEFAGDVQINGDLTVDGEINGDITPPFQGDIPCKEIDANAPGDTFTGTDQNDWNPTSSGYNGQTSIIICRATQTTNLTGFVNQGQCYVVLISPTDNVGVQIRILGENAASDPDNQFMTGPNVPVLQPGEAINLFYSDILKKWVLVSHL